MAQRLALLFILLITAAGCSKGAARDDAPVGPVPPERQPIDAAAVARATAAPGVDDPAGWAADLTAALAASELGPTTERVCSALAVAEQESGFVADRPIADPGALVDAWIAAATYRYEPAGKGPFKDALTQVFATAAKGQSQSFMQRLRKSTTEGQMFAIYAELVDTFDYSWPRAFETVKFAGEVDDIGVFDFHPLDTAGCMGVPVEFIEARARADREDLSEAMARAYTRTGCLDLGVAKLLGGHDGYDDPIYRFAEHHGERFASRNAALQERIHTLTGRPIPYDGRLLFYEGNGEISLRPSPTFLALLALRDRYGLPLSESKMMRDLGRERERRLEDTDTWAKIQQTYLSNTGRDAVYARIPDLDYKDREGAPRTAAWFANQAVQRYRGCLLRIGGAG